MARGLRPLARLAPPVLRGALARGRHSAAGRGAGGGAGRAPRRRGARLPAGRGQLRLRQRGGRTRQGRPLGVGGGAAPERTMNPAAASRPNAAAFGRRPGALPRLLLSSAARALLWLGPVYLAGYLGLSGSWVLLGLALWLCWGRNRRWKRDRLAAAFALLEDEREAVCRGLADRHLPAWVSEDRGQRRCAAPLRADPHRIPPAAAAGAPGSGDAAGGRAGGSGLRGWGAPGGAAGAVR